MVLMAIVICLHALISVEHSDAAEVAYIVRLWGTRVRNPRMSFLCCSQIERDWKWKSELDRASLYIPGRRTWDHEKR